MKQYDELLHRLKDTEDVVSAQELIDRAIAYKKHMSTKLQRKNLEIQSRLNEIAADLQETEQRISNLKQHRFSYPLGSPASDVACGAGITQDRKDGKAEDFV